MIELVWIEFVKIIAQPRPNLNRKILIMLDDGFNQT